MENNMIECLETCRELDGLREKKYELEETLEKQARKLLDELKEIPGWDILVEDGIRGHYESYPDEFFKWCDVVHYSENGRTVVVFRKGYSWGDEIDALKLYLDVPLWEQVDSRLKKAEDEKTKAEAKRTAAEYSQYLRLKEKFGGS